MVVVVGDSATLDQCFQEVTFELSGEHEDLSQEYSQNTGSLGGREVSDRKSA